MVPCDASRVYYGMCVLTALIIKVVTPTTDWTDSAQYTEGIIIDIIYPGLETDHMST